MRKVVLIIIGVILASCQAMHVTPTHNTPYFTGRNQFEVALDAGGNGGNLNCAYSPLNHLSLLVNAHSNGPEYNNRMEFGLGTFFNLRKNKLLGITVGEGLGQVYWDRWPKLSDFTGVLNQASFRSKNYFAGLYFAFRNDSSSRVIQTVSFKYNYFDDYYEFIEVNNYKPDRENFYFRQSSYELCYSLKIRLYRKLNFLGIVGGGVLPSNFDYGNTFPIVRVGLNLKF